MFFLLAHWRTEAGASWSQRRGTHSAFSICAASLSPRDVLSCRVTLENLCFMACGENRRDTAENTSLCICRKNPSVEWYSSRAPLQSLRPWRQNNTLSSNALCLWLAAEALVEGCAPCMPTDEGIALSCGFVSWRSR